jgi:hypothetical protein
MTHPNLRGMQLDLHVRGGHLLVNQSLITKSLDYQDLG